MVSIGTNALRQLGSARQLAKTLGVSRNTLLGWHRGLRCPSEAARTLMQERLQIPVDAWDKPAELVPIVRKPAEGREAARRERVEAANANVTVVVRPHPEGGFTVQVGPHVYRALYANRVDVERTAQRVASRNHRPHECDEHREVPVGQHRATIWGSEYAIDRRGHV